MKRTLLMRVGIILIAVFIIVGVVLTLLLMNERNRGNVLDIGLDGTISPIEFGGFKMVPGDATEYKLAFTGRAAGAYDTVLSFSDADPSGRLKDFIRVRILSGQTEIYDELLADAMNGKSVSLRVDFEKNENTELILIYYMPLEVGNEAKLTTADFRLNITSNLEES